jgi:hypothetical protein
MSDHNLTHYIEFQGPSQQLEELFYSYARLRHAWVRKKRGGALFLIICGYAFSLQPNTLAYTISVSLGGKGLGIGIHPRWLPLTAKVKRILSYRLREFIDYVQYGPKGLPTRPFGTVGYQRGLTGVSGWLLWFAFSCMVGFLFTMFAATLCGLSIMGPLLTTLHERSLLIHSLGHLPLPSLRELASIDLPFRLGCACWFGLPISAVVSLPIALFLGASEIWGLLSRYMLWFLLFWVILLFLGLGPFMGPVVALGYALLIPLACYFGYQFIWHLKREYLRDRMHPKRVSSPQLIAISLLLIFGVAIYLDIKGRGDVVQGLALFRDRVLLRAPFGETIANSYYLHTRYCAEPLEPFLAKIQRTVLVLFVDDLDVDWMLKVGGFIVHRVDNRSQIDLDRWRLYHLIVIPKNRPNLEENLRRMGLERKTLIYLGKVIGDKFISLWDGSGFESVADAIRHVEQATFRGENLRQVVQLGWGALFLGGVTVAVLLGSGACVFVFMRFPLLGVIGLSLLLAGYYISADPERRIIHEIRSAPAGEQGSFGVFARYARDPSSPSIRYEAVYQLYRYLHKFKDPRALPVLREALVDRADPRIRAWAAGGLGMLGDTSVQDMLVEALKDPALFVRYRAAEALGQIGDARAIEPLREVVRNDIWYVGLYAQSAILKILGRGGE